MNFYDYNIIAQSFQDFVQVKNLEESKLFSIAGILWQRCKMLSEPRISTQ